MTLCCGSRLSEEEEEWPDVDDDDVASMSGVGTAGWSRSAPLRRPGRSRGARRGLSKAAYREVVVWWRGSGDGEPGGESAEWHYGLLGFGAARRKGKGDSSKGDTWRGGSAAFIASGG